jgi:serine/threonine protein kinase
MFYFRMLPAAGRCCGFACCSGQMFSETAAVSHGGRGGGDDDEHLFTTTPTAATPTPRDSAEVVLRELGIERLTRGEFERCFKRTFGCRSRVLGTGSFATVFLHRDCRLSAGPGEFVATKTPKQDVEQDLVWRELLYHAVASRDCEHIVRLRAWIDDGVGGGVASPAGDGFGGAILEHCRETLMAMTKAYEGLLPVDTQSTVLRGTARGLAHIHAFAIAHFDLSPGNILIHWLSDSGLVAKIADFGCSRRLRTPPPGSANVLWPTSLLQGPSYYPEYQKAVSPTDVTCTWTYRAPEITLGLPYAFPTDVWSLGVIARELATGRNLFHLGSETCPLVYASFMCGPITNAVWPDVQSAPFYKPPATSFKPDVWAATRFSKVDKITLDFIHSILQADPAKRPTAAGLVASNVWVSNDVTRLRHSGLQVAMPGASPAAASVGGVGASHSAKTAKRQGSTSLGSGVRSGAEVPDRPAAPTRAARQCQCCGPYSCGSWKICQATSTTTCSQPTIGDFCSQCVFSFCLIGPYVCFLNRRAH